MLGISRAEILDAQWADNGPGWVAVLLEDADAVLAVRPSYAELDIGVVGPHPSGAGEAIEVRAFFPKAGALVEDPVTGSLNASLADWLLRTGRVAAPYVARQGTALGRAGRVHVTQDADGHDLGGWRHGDVHRRRGGAVERGERQRRLGRGGFGRNRRFVPFARRFGRRGTFCRVWAARTFLCLLAGAAERNETPPPPAETPSLPSAVDVSGVPKPTAHPAPRAPHP